MKRLKLLMLLGIMALFIASAFADGLDTANDPNVVLWLDFEDEEPKDLSPKQTMLSDVTAGTVVEGIMGNAWLFEEGTRLSILGQSMVIPFKETTVSVWVLNSSDTGILYEEGGGTNGHCIQLSGGLLHYCARDAGLATCIQADFPVNDDEWHFVATVFNNGAIELYIDGEMVADEDNVTGIGSHANETGIGHVGIPTVGVSCTTNAGQWTGVMDRLVVTRRVATAQEIKEEFQDSGGTSVNANDKATITWGDIKITYR